MQEYFFANYRLLTDDEISERESMQYLSAFRNALPYAHTFTLRLGDSALLDAKYETALAHPIVSETTGFEIRRGPDGWSFISKDHSAEGNKRERQVLACSRDYSDMTLYMPKDALYRESGRERSYFLPFKTMVRVACNVGIAFHSGLSIHASYVGKDGYGVLFVGPSGMGKSTQAELWERYRGTEIVNGDGPILFEADGAWYAAGIPWDGKDQIYKQRNLPVKAVIVLEQAKENHIERLNAVQAMTVLLKLILHPIWDNDAMDQVTALLYRCAGTVPFYHLKNLPNEDAVALTEKTINEQG